MQPTPTKYRLLTRSDMDGLVCAVLLKEMGMLGEIVFHHPKDVQDGKVAVTERDILTNLPYVPGCGLCFDHHASEGVRNSGQPTPNYILKPDAKSAARVVYDYYGGKARFPRVSDAMMEARLPVEWMVNHRTDIDLHGLLPKMKTAGCWAMFFGIESASARLQKEFRKGLKRDGVVSTIRSLSDLGIASTCSFVIGFPTEPARSFLRVSRWPPS